MENSISYYRNKLMQEVDLPGNQEKIDVAEPKGKITAADFAKLRSNKDVKEESEDHEVSMANNSIETIIKAAMELKTQLGNNEKDIPAWIQDHISKAENYITQASQNYHEYGDHEVEDMPVNGALEKIMEKVLNKK
jgi:vacuolar-type H+-ATPase subunit H